MVPRSNADSRGRFDRNRKASPLLDNEKCPPEVRSKIYEYVFGGKEIHIITSEKRAHNNFKLHHSICQANGTERARAEKVKQKSFDLRGDPVEVHFQNKCACRQRPPFFPDGRLKPLSLSLLLACRQIHDEAALLPFSSNAFVFGNDGIVADFLKKVGPQQSGAIRNIVLTHRLEGPLLHFDKDLDKVDCGHRRSILRAGLSGVESMTVHVLTRSYDDFTSDTDRWIGTLEDFAVLPLKSVVAVIQQALIYRSNTDISMETLRAWEEKAEKMLLRRIPFKRSPRVKDQEEREEKDQALKLSGSKTTKCAETS